MKIIILSVFISFGQIIYGQMLDVQTKLYDLFVPSSCSYITGNEDLRYHPAKDTFSAIYSINMNMSYHDIFGERAPDGGGNKSSYMYDTGLESGFPLRLFLKNFKLNLQLQHHILTTFYDTKNSGAEFNGKNWEFYTFSSGLLLDDYKNKAGLRINYSIGILDAALSVNQYPYNSTNQFIEQYFFGLLEPAFGNNIQFKIKANSINYAAEYIRAITPSFNIGINFYNEINNYNTGIKYFGNVEKLKGEKDLSGLFEYARYSLGLTFEYNIKNFVLRSSATYSVPVHKLNINQNHLISKNNVNLEISDLSRGNLTGRGTMLGIGLSYAIRRNMQAGISLSWIRNNYKAALKASTPVLGFEILPIAHQFQTGFYDKMSNALFSIAFNHVVNNKWSYALAAEYLKSGNEINYYYNIITEFGFGSSTESQDTRMRIDIYKIDLKTKLFITDRIGIKLLFGQYIPVLRNNHSASDITEFPASGGSDDSKIKYRGGSTYSLSLIYNFN